MATLNDLREIAASLPEVTVDDIGQFALSVTIKGKLKGFVWAWAERVHPKKPRVINNGVMAIRVPSMSAKEVILGSHDESQIFDEPHYSGFPAVLVRIDAIDVEELTDLVVEAWRCKAPKGLVDAYDASVENATVQRA